MTSILPTPCPEQSPDNTALSIVNMLERSGNKDLANLPHTSRYTFVFLQTTKARQQYRLEATPDLLLFCTLALARGVEFDREPAIACLLSRVAEEGLSFGKAYWENFRAWHDNSMNPDSRVE